MQIGTTSAKGYVVLDPHRKRGSGAPIFFLRGKLDPDTHKLIQLAFFGKRPIFLTMFFGRGERNCESGQKPEKGQLTICINEKHQKKILRILKGKESLDWSSRLAYGAGAAALATLANVLHGIPALANHINLGGMQSTLSIAAFSVATMLSKRVVGPLILATGLVMTDPDEIVLRFLITAGTICWGLAEYVHQCKEIRTVKLALNALINSAKKGAWKTKY